MEKSNWAKGKIPQVMIAVRTETRDFAKSLAVKEKIKIKDLVNTAIKEYALKRGLET